MKLRSKIYLYTSVLFALLLTAASITIYIAFSSMSIKHELEQLKAEALYAVNDIKQQTDQRTLEELLRAYVPINGMIVLLFDNSGVPTIVTSENELALSNHPTTYFSTQQLEVQEIDKVSYGFVNIPFISANGQVANLQMMSSLSDLVGLLSILRIVLLIVACCVMLPALISSRVLGSVIMQPIQGMIKTMREIVRSGSFVRLKQEGRSKDELLEMGQTFNEMITLLESNYSKQEQFVANASHELKTPITVIESYSSLLRRRVKQQPELLEESLEAIHSEAVRMKAMTEQLLLLAKPHRQWKLDITELDLVGLAERTASKFQKAYQRQVELRLPQHGAVVVSSDEDKLTQLLIILLDNARKYSDATIIIEVGRSEHEGYIAVEDSGIGIASHELEHIFERFYQVDKSRNKAESVDVGGAGLGLSLAQEIAEVIGARITMKSEEGVGTTASIHLPFFSAKSNLS